MKLLNWPLRLAALGACGACWLLAGIYLYLSPGLPDVETLRDVRLQTPMRVYTRNGDLIGQFGEQKRNPLRYDDIPETFVLALLAAEDDRFFEHRGIAVGGLLRAVSELVLTGEKARGAARSPCRWRATIFSPLSAPSCANSMRSSSPSGLNGV